MCKRRPDKKKKLKNHKRNDLFTVNETGFRLPYMEASLKVQIEFPTVMKKHVMNPWTLRTIWQRA
jgi:hypothetical protein